MAVIASGSDEFNHEKPGGDGGGGPRGYRGVPTPAPPGSMGDAVTPHALITDTGPTDWRYLLCGLDTVDLGLYVDWQNAWPEIQPQLQFELEQSRQGETAIWFHPVAGKAIVTGSSKRNYRFHLQYPDFHMWIADTCEPKGYPNVYVSPTAKTLWTIGLDEFLTGLHRWFFELGATVDQVQVSRVDLAADFYIESGMTLDFLRSHRVSRTRSTNHYEDDDTLETFYLGRKASPVQARIYDKLKKVLKTPETAFFMALWGGPVQAWRVEFQLRRTLLRQLNINTVDDLKAQAGGLWTYLTDEWFSLRLPDNRNTKRRTVHPWWAQVQNLAGFFGPACSISRDLADIPKVPTGWYVAHIAGCMPPLAARLGLAQLDQALDAMLDLVRDKLGMKSWDDEYAKQRIRLQQLPEGDDPGNEGADDVPF